METAEVLRGKKALIIGGSGGIGASLCRMMSQYGVPLIIHGSKNSEKFECLLQDVQKNTAAEKIIFPFSDTSSLYAFAALPEFTQACAEADIICVCYGPFVKKKLHETAASEWIHAALFDYALAGICVSSVLPHMIQKNWGRIILFGGSRTDVPGVFRSNAAYAGAKTGLSTLVKSAAAEYSRYNITCNAVIPGVVETEYNSEIDIHYLMQHASLRRTVPSDAAAQAALFLLSSPFVNGALFRVDDGWNP